MESLITQTIIRTNIENPPPTPPVPATSTSAPKLKVSEGALAKLKRTFPLPPPIQVRRTEELKSSKASFRKALSGSRSPFTRTPVRASKDSAVDRRCWDIPPPPPVLIHDSSLNKAKPLAASQFSSSQAQYAQAKNTEPKNAPTKSTQTQDPKSNTPDAITAACLPTLADETPQPSIFETVSATTTLRDHILDSLIDKAEHELYMRAFQRRYDEYIDMMSSMKSVLTDMEERGLDEKSFEGMWAGKRYEAGVKVAKALDGQQVTWEEGEEEHEELATGIIRDYEVLEAVLKGGGGERVLVPEGEEKEEFIRAYMGW